MTTKIHGGVPTTFTNLAGSLTEVTIAGTEIGWNSDSSGLGGVANEVGTNITPNSPAEVTYEILSTRSTVVTWNATDNLITAVVENAGDSWFVTPPPGTTATPTLEAELNAAFAGRTDGSGAIVTSVTLGQVYQKAF